MTTCAALTGCARHAAPTLSLFGSYFPIWILCGILAVFAAVATRVLLVAAGLSDTVPAPLAVCTAAGMIVGSLVWLWLGQ